MRLELRHRVWLVCHPKLLTSPRHRLPRKHVLRNRLEEWNGSSARTLRLTEPIQVSTTSDIWQSTTGRAEGCHWQIYAKSRIACLTCRAIGCQFCQKNNYDSPTLGAPPRCQLSGDRELSVRTARIEVAVGGLRNRVVAGSLPML